LFWYGFDPADSDGGVADKTVFGGTKGKFNGLEFLKDGQEALWQAEQNRTPRSSNGGSTTPPRSRLPPPATTNPTFRTDDSRRNGYYDTTREEEESDTFLEDSDYYDNDDYDDDNEYYDTTKSNAQVPFRPSPIKPPEEKPYPRRDSPIAPRQRRQRQRPQGSYFEGADDDDDAEDDTQADYGSRRRQRQQQRQGSEKGDWVSKQVSSWFSGGEDNNRMNRNEPMDDDDSSVGRRRRRRQQQDSEWSPMNVINTFLGVDREKMAYQAELYNQNMGLGGAARGSRPGQSNNRRAGKSAGSRSGGSRQRRPGYAYRYSPEDEEEAGYIDPAATTYDVQAEPDVEGVRGATRTTSNEGGKDVAEPLRERERSWEERQLAVERIPPNVVAWGPSGEIGMDARTKAILDALEDVQTARQKVDIKEKKEALAREDITILKV
jgi:hypothetical protein